MQLETERLILRSFAKTMSILWRSLLANPDFMRFSLGVFTERKQTIAFVEKVMGWIAPASRRSLPSSPAQ